jgi:hypothetical protein
MRGSRPRKTTQNPFPQSDTSLSSRKISRTRTALGKSGNAASLFDLYSVRTCLLLIDMQRRPLEPYGFGVCFRACSAEHRGTAGPDLGSGSKRLTSPLELHVEFFELAGLEHRRFAPSDHVRQRRDALAIAGARLVELDDIG